MFNIQRDMKHKVANQEPTPLVVAGTLQGQELMFEATSELELNKDMSKNNPFRSKSFRAVEDSA